MQADGVWLPIAALRALVGLMPYRKILSNLTCTEIPHPGRAKQYARRKLLAYKVSGDGKMLCVPIGRAGILVKLVGKPPRMMRPACAPQGAPLAASAIVRGEQALPLYDYQTVAVSHISNALTKQLEEAGVGSFYIEMDTGTGKTIVGCEVIIARKVRTVIIVPNHAIAEQWFDELNDRLPHAKTALFQNAKPVNPELYDVVVIIINTASGLPAPFYSAFGLAILDEAHEYVSPEYHKVLWHIQHCAQHLGLSGTPTGHPSGMDRWSCLMLGAAVKLSAITDYVPPVFQGSVRVVQYWAQPEYTAPVAGPQGTTSAIMTVGHICEDPYRLKVVVDEIIRLATMHVWASPIEKLAAGLDARLAAGLDSGTRQHGVLVFAEHRAYLDAINEEIRRRDPGLDVECELDEPIGAAGAGVVSVLRGGIKSGALSEARGRGAHIVLTTYGYCRRGVSLKDMTALVLASPRRNGGIQITGRILRQGSDMNIKRVIVDIVDRAMTSQLTDRKKAYKVRGFPVSEVTIRAPHAEPPVVEPTEEENALAALSLDELLSLAGCV